MKKIMLRATIITLLISAFTTACGQKDKTKRKSPPEQVTKTIGDLKITVDYSRPYLKERELNTLAPVGKIWRTGANEASWIDFSKDVTINGTSIPKGKYGLFTINNKSEWTIIFNKIWDQWGAYKYNKSEDQARITVKPQDLGESTEQFTISIKDSGEVQLKWAKKLIAFEVK